MLLIVNLFILFFDFIITIVPVVVVVWIHQEETGPSRI